MGLAIMVMILNSIIWFVILPIILIKYFGHRTCDFDNDFIFCGFIITVLSFVGTIVMILMLLKETGTPFYKKYIEIIDKNLGGDNEN